MIIMRTFKIFPVLALTFFALLIQPAFSADKIKSAKKNQNTTQTETPSPEASPAASPTPSPEPTATPVKEEEKSSDLYGKKNRLLGNFVVGPYVTAVSLPRPISFGAEAKWIDLLGVSGGYGFFPELTLGEVKLKITGYDFRFKIYPFKKAFYVGIGYGKQTFSGSTTKDILSTATTITLSQENTFIAPQIGWNWIWDSGIFLGMDLGVQLSMQRNTQVVSNASGAVTSTPDYQDMEKSLNDMGELIGKTPLPLLTFVKIGYFF